ncbi:hypothetical protein KIN20_002596 [Parelaphostrongylus tenuis]|uniref:Mos1 transposase HTH domain-containing protein n=1 Tax=Parelaphostrongylus tenuis TaxID=148309 RepID=A0AAD5LVG8_PARTN|nr:hypothetical protein KIN20_002596 [Parelaphostrongylus tenuis]
MAAQRSLLDRSLLLYEYEFGRDSQTALENKKFAKVQVFVSGQAAFCFFAEFRTDNTNLEDQLHSTRLRKFHRMTVIEADKENPTVTIEELANDFNCGLVTISIIMKVVGSATSTSPQSQRAKRQHKAACRQTDKEEVNRTGMRVAGSCAVQF